jgi:hypothetical protein
MRLQLLHNHPNKLRHLHQLRLPSNPNSPSTPLLLVAFNNPQTKFKP